MKTIWTLKPEPHPSLPERYRADDVRSPIELVRCVLNEFTRPGDVVFDPFAGFGTTLAIAAEMGRTGYGVEFLPDRVAYIRSILRNPENIVHGSALALDAVALPPVDFSFTSPPYMSKNDHAQYPFAAYEITGDGYDQYLRDIEDVYRQLKRKLKPGAYVVLEISNIWRDGVLTPLAWDVAARVATVLPLRREIIATWETEGDAHAYGFGYDHCYCLVFQNAENL